MGEAEKPTGHGAAAGQASGDVKITGSHELTEASGQGREPRRAGEAGPWPPGGEEPQGPAARRRLRGGIEQRLLGHVPEVRVTLRQCPRGSLRDPAEHAAAWGRPRGQAGPGIEPVGLLGPPRTHGAGRGHPGKQHPTCSQWPPRPHGLHHTGTRRHWEWPGAAGHRPTALAPSSPATLPSPWEWVGQGLLRAARQRCLGRGAALLARHTGAEPKTGPKRSSSQDGARRKLALGVALVCDGAMGKEDWPPLHPVLSQGLRCHPPCREVGRVRMTQSQSHQLQKGAQGPQALAPGGTGQQSGQLLRPGVPSLAQAAQAAPGLQAHAPKLPRPVHGFKALSPRPCGRVSSCRQGSPTSACG